MKKMWKIEKMGILLVKRTPPPTPHLPFPNILDLSAHLHYILDLSRMVGTYGLSPGYNAGERLKIVLS